MTRKRILIAGACACACAGVCGCASRQAREQSFGLEALEPRTHLAAQAYDWRNVVMKGTGFVNGVVFSPAQSGLVYANTDMGGAYRWDQSTNKWTPLTDWIQTTDWSVNYNGAETIAVDPTDASRVYLGLGTYQGPSAVLRSSDQGRTWQRTNVAFPMNGNGNGRNAGQRMMVDPNSPNVLFYGTRSSGIYKSTDYGATWNKVTSYAFTTDASGATQNVGTDWMLIDKSSGTTGNPSQVIYAGAATTGTTKIWRSGDGGANWAALPGQVPTGSNQFPLHGALTPDGNTLYLTYGVGDVGPNNVTGGFVYKVANPKTATPTWSSIAPSLSQGGWSGVTLDPNNPSTLFISTIDSWGPIDDIYRSTNGGASWTKLNANNNRDNSSATYAGNPNKLHWTGDVELDPFNPNHVIFNTGYGLYASTNALAATPTWSFFNDGIDQSAVLELASPSNGAVNLLSAIGDQDGFRHVDFSVSPAAGRFGQSNGLAVGSTDDIDVAWTNANYVVRTTHTSPYVQYSLDNGVTWAWFPSTGVSGGGSGTGNVAISADGTKTVYEPDGAGQTIYSTRSGSTWSSWTVPATGRPANGAKLVADLVDATTFYAYIGTTLARSTDGGANWSVMSSSAPSGGMWIRAVPGNAGHLLITTGSGGLWRSTNGGASWSRINSSTVTVANEVGVGAPAPTQSYPAIFIGGTVSGQNGFFRSDDQGATWAMISDTSHQYGDVTVIQGDPRVYGRLYVGANGRGVLYADIHQGPTTLPTGWSTQDIGNPGSPGSAGSAAAESFEVIGGGTGIGGTSDQFRFAYTQLSGDGSITARVISNPLASPANNNAKAGVMIRNDLTAGSAQGFIGMTSGAVNGAVFQSRSSAGGSTSTTNFTGVWNPYWVRLTRSGSAFKAERSSDGVNWVQIGSTQTIGMNANAYVGLAVTSSDNSQLDIASFDNLAVTPTNAVSISGTSAADTIRLVRNGASTEVWLNGNLQGTFDPAAITSLSIDALDGDDTITLDFTGGNPLPTTIATNITGGAGSDLVAIVGSSSPDTAIFEASSIAMNGASIALSGTESQSFDGAGGFDDLTVNSGTTVALAATVQKLNSLAINGSGALDLRDNDLIVDYSGASPLASIQVMINAARSGGSWTGSGLTSSTARDNAAHNTTLGAIEASDYPGGSTFDGEPLDATMVLVKYTYYGDADFNGRVNFDDYVRTDNGFNNHRSGWNNGDFDGNGLVNFDDYVLIDLAFNTQGPPL
jgi:regulation of enolase protein 1 (concanavalin A-like superfamily)